MRGLFVCLSVLFAVPAQAAITPEAFRELAYVGDIAAADSALKEAHAQSLNGEITFDDLREITQSIVSTHPDLLQFVEDWRTVDPENPYVMTLQALQIDRLAWNIRGERLLRDTPPAALDAFRALRAFARDLAHDAYESLPDFVPTSDAVLRLELGQRSLDDDMHLRLTGKMMEATPNSGSLEAALSIMQRSWGGPGVFGVAGYCDAFAEMTDIPDYTADICAADWIGNLRNQPTPGEQAFAHMVLDDTDHPRLERLAVKRAIANPDPRHRAFLLDWFAQEDNVDMKMASRFLRAYPSTPESWEILYSLRDRAYAEAMERLRHDPYNPQLLDLLLGDGLPLLGIGSGFTSEQLQDWNRRMIHARPYDLSVWSRAISSERLRTTITDVKIVAPYYENLIYYSGHNSGFDDYLQKLLSADHMHRMHRVDPWYGDGSSISEAEYEEHVVCPGVRVVRVRMAVCEWQRIEASDCFGRRVVDRTHWLSEEAVDRDICHWERTASIDVLGYAPQVVDIPILPGTIANR